MDRRAFLIAGFCAGVCGLGVLTASPRSAHGQGSGNGDIFPHTPKKSRKKMTVRVAANQVQCSGAFGPRQCLKVTFPDKHTETLSEGIRGYKHIEGKPRRLLVERIELDTSNPVLMPQDISSIQYRFIKDLGAS